MFDWLTQGVLLKIAAGVAAVAVAAGLWMYVDLTLTKSRLHDEQELRKEWQRTAEVQSNIQHRDTVIVRASDEADRAIQEAPNANTPVPTELAAAWAAGIDSVRDAATKNAGEHDVPGPTSDPSKRRGADSRPTSTVLKGSRGSIPTV